MSVRSLLVFAVLSGGCPSPETAPTTPGPIPESTIALGPASVPVGAQRIDGGVDIDPSGSGVRLCAVPAGDLYVLWADARRDPTSDALDLWMNHSVDGVSWLEAPVRVNGGPAGGVWNPQLACSDDGVFVVWESDRDGDSGNHQIHFNTSTDGGQTFFPDDVLLESDPDGFSMSIDPQITVQGSDLYVVWSDNANGAYDIFGSSSSDLGNSFRPHVRIDSDDPAGSAHSGRPQVAFGRDSLDIRVVWEDARDGQLDIWFARPTTAAPRSKRTPGSIGATPTEPPTRSSHSCAATEATI